jgi:2-aminobenzoate-CoA ligase
VLKPAFEASPEMALRCRTSSRSRSRPTNIRARSLSDKLPRTETGKLQRFKLRNES